jgi:hypothetical protein
VGKTIGKIGKRIDKQSQREKNKLKAHKKLADFVGS